MRWARRNVLRSRALRDNERFFTEWGCAETGHAMRCLLRAREGVGGGMARIVGRRVRERAKTAGADADCAGYPGASINDLREARRSGNVRKRRAGCVMFIPAGAELREGGIERGMAGTAAVVTRF